ncbi:MAG: HAD family hydrolase [Oscillospiraceae bacterium]|nr:HAD family hydrolase [Oscillospiraceae bacterium]
MNIKMIVTDLDNTLLRSDKSISDYTVSILSSCQAKDIKVVFATARSTQASSKFFEMFTPDIFIGYGGALAYANEKVINRFDISADISFQLINDCLKEPEITSILAINESAAFTNRLDTLDSESSHYKYTDFTVKNNQSYLKISLRAANPGIVERIALNYPMCDMLRYTGEDLYRFANRSAVKWNAVNAVADYYNINTDMIAAFGDDINDLEMLKHCGIGIAVANAVDEVKAVADYICDTNDNDGAAKWLEEKILI